MTFSGRFVLNLVDFAALKGVERGMLLDLTGHSAAELMQEDLRLQSKVYNAVVERAVALSGDPLFGLHAGEYLNLSAAGLISQITQTSRTVKEALDYCCEFAALGCRAMHMTFSESNGRYRLVFIPDPAWQQESAISVRQTIDGTFAFTLREFHALTRYKHYPLAIQCSYEQPASSAEYERVYGCRPAWGQAQNAMIFDADHINQPIVTSDYNLLRLLVAFANEKMAAIAGEEAFVTVVKRSVINMVKPEFPGIDEVAANLNISVRTLQRKLREEGHTFKEIIDELRREFAFSYLRRPELHIAEIAYLLSYADASAFIRSFKRQTGLTPQVWRQRNC